MHLYTKNNEMIEDFKSHQFGSWVYLEYLEVPLNYVLS